MRPTERRVSRAARASQRGILCPSHAPFFRVVVVQGSKKKRKRRREAEPAGGEPADEPMQPEAVNKGLSRVQMNEVRSLSLNAPARSRSECRRRRRAREPPKDGSFSIKRKVAHADAAGGDEPSATDAAAAPDAAPDAAPAPAEEAAAAPAAGEITINEMDL